MRLFYSSVLVPECTFLHLGYGRTTSYKPKHAGTDYRFYNYQKLSALLADYGFVTMRLSDDWNGADLIAQHINGDTFLKIQLKSRLTFCEKYIGKSIYVAFRRGLDWYLYPHDEMLEKVHKIVKFKHTSSWKNNGVQSFAKLSKSLFQILDPYQIEPSRNLQRKLALDDEN